MLYVRSLRNPRWALPRHADKQRGLGELCPKIRKSPVSRSAPRQAPLFAKPTRPTAHQAKNG